MFVNGSVLAAQTIFTASGSSTKTTTGNSMRHHWFVESLILELHARLAELKEYLRSLVQANHPLGNLIGQMHTPMFVHAHLQSLTCLMSLERSQDHQPASKNNLVGWLPQWLAFLWKAPFYLIKIANRRSTMQ